MILANTTFGVLTVNKAFGPKPLIKAFRVGRLIREQSSMLAFAFKKEVPFTNNLAERDIWPAKVKLKISIFFRTKSSADICASNLGSNSYGVNCRNQ
jgi:hypothetical protein